MAKYLGIPLQVAGGQAVTPTYGSQELVVDGDFPAGTTAWQAENGATITIGTHEGRSNVANINVTATGQSRVKQPFDFVNGVKYQITVEVFLVSGAFRVDAVDEDAPNDFVSTTTTGSWQTLTGTFTGARTNSGNIFLRGDSAVAQFYVDSISIKEVPFVLGEEIVSSDYIPANFTAGNGWTLNGSSASRGVATNTDYLVSNITSQLVDSKSYQVGFTLSDMSQASTAGISSTGAFGQVGTDLKFRSTDGSNLFYSVYDEGQGTSPDLRFVSGTNALTFTLSGITVKEVQYNYLQVVGGDFLKQCKVGDVVFNYSDDTEAVVLQVISNDVLLLSNDILSDAGDSFFIFAPNGDTRGNQLLRIDNYIISEYDEASSLPNKSSFWFAAGPQADKVTLQQLNNAVNTYFVADVIEMFVQRLNARSATASRLDIPLNEFRDHKYNQVLTTTAITLS